MSNTRNVFNRSFRPVYAIANDILNDMRAQAAKKGIPVSRAFPTSFVYVEPMLSMKQVSERYICDFGIVNYFMCNAREWKGEVARKIKEELRDMIKADDKRRRNDSENRR